MGCALSDYFSVGVEWEYWTGEREREIYVECALIKNLKVKWFFLSLLLVYACSWDWRGLLKMEGVLFGPTTDRLLQTRWVLGRAVNVFFFSFFSLVRLCYAITCVALLFTLIAFDVVLIFFRRKIGKNISRLKFNISYCFHNCWQKKFSNKFDRVRSVYIENRGSGGVRSELLYQYFF